jgi:Flp pilus assembly protein protease CpaA
LFIAGGCGGGDVKLFAAVGAWVGAGAALWVFVGAAVVLMALSVVRLSVSVTAMTSSGKLVKVGQGQPRQHSRWMTYSFPLMVGTLAVLWWYLHQELSRVS